MHNYENLDDEFIQRYNLINLDGDLAMESSTMRLVHIFTSREVVSDDTPSIADLVIFLDELSAIYSFDRGSLATNPFRLLRRTDGLDSFGDLVPLAVLENHGYCATDSLKERYHLSALVSQDALEFGELQNLFKKAHNLTESYAVSSQVVESICYALLMGNLIVQGPPGTGKTSLIRKIAREVFNVRLVEVTANLEWTVYDLVGRKTLDLIDGKETVVPEDGHLVRAIVECCEQIAKHEASQNEPQAVWILVDEINRCKIDRAFGEFFTVLGDTEEQRLQLSHQPSKSNVLFAPKRFRIVGTMNTVDKSFVNSFSQAFARRFGFVNVDIPRSPSLLAKEQEISIERSLMQASAILRRHIEQSHIESIRPGFELIDKFVELVRTRENQPPVLELGTAQVIDTKVAFIVKAMSAPTTVTDQNRIIENVNWALSYKLLAQLDSDMLSEDEKEQFLKKIPSELRSTHDDLEKLWGF